MLTSLTHKLKQLSLPLILALNLGYSTPAHAQPTQQELACQQLADLDTYLDVSIHEADNKEKCLDLPLQQLYELKHSCNNNTSKPTKKTLNMLINKIYTEKSCINEAYFVLQTLSDFLNESQKDKMVDKILAAHNFKAYYGFNDYDSAYLIRGLLYSQLTGEIDVSGKNIKRLTTSLVELGKDRECQFLVDYFLSELDEKDLDKCLHKINYGGYTPFWSDIQPLENINLEKLTQAKSIKVIVHPFYVPLYSQQDLLGEKEFQSQLSEFDMYELAEKLTQPGRYTFSQNLVRSLELYQLLDSFEESKQSDEITILLVPPARFEELYGTKFFQGDDESNLRLASLLEDLTRGSKNFYYLETASVIDGHISPESIEFLSTHLPPAAQIRVQGGFLTRCELSAARKLAELGNPLLIDIEHSSVDQTRFDLEFKVGKDIQDTFIQNNLAFQQYFKDLATSYEEKLRELRKINPEVNAN